jgi:hypothetical protein
VGGRGGSPSPFAAHPADRAQSTSQSKAAVEAGVLSAERWVLAPLRNRKFFSLAELNAAMWEKLAELNSRPPAPDREHHARGTG